MALTPTDPNKNGENKDAPKLSAEDEIAMREIDEAVRKDDAQEFAKKYGLPIGGALAIFLAGLGFYLLYWVPSQEGALESESEAIVKSLDASQQRDFDAAIEEIGNVAESDTPGARTAARFVLAGAALEQKRFDDAVALYKQIADDEEAPAAMRDMARIREVTTNYDDRKPEDIIARLKDLAVPGNAFFGSAGELVAIAHLEAGDKDKAGALFASMAKDENLPDTLRTRSRQMAGLLGVDAIEDVDQLLEDEGVTTPEGNGEEAGTDGAQDQ